jgi:hypothetical protein
LLRIEAMQARGDAQGATQEASAVVQRLEESVARVSGGPKPDPASGAVAVLMLELVIRETALARIVAPADGSRPDVSFDEGLAQTTIARSLVRAELQRLADAGTFSCS